MDGKLRYKRVVSMSIAWLVLQAVLSVAGLHGYWIPSERLVTALSLSPFYGSVWINLLGVVLVPPLVILFSKDERKLSQVEGALMAVLLCMVLAELVLGTVSGVAFISIMIAAIAAALVILIAAVLIIMAILWLLSKLKWLDWLKSALNFAGNILWPTK